MSKPEISQQPQGLATKKSVVAGLCARYGVEEDTALKMVAYDMIFRGLSNRAHATASVADRVEFQDGVGSSVTGLVKDGVGAIPVFGGIASFLASLVNKGVKTGEMHFHKKEADALIAMNPSSDPREWGDFSKDLAMGCISQRVNAIKNMKPEEVTDLAKRDFATVLEGIVSGKVKGNIFQEETIPNLLKPLPRIKSAQAELVGNANEKPSSSIAHASAHKLAPEHQHGHAAAAA